MNFNNKKIVLFGCKSTTKLLFDLLLEQNCLAHLITIDEKKGISQKVADYKSLTDYSTSNDIPVYIANKYSLKSEEDINFFKENKFDLAFVIGWQRLIPGVILDTFSIGVFGMHGSSINLPKGRGRSPMNWAIIEGRKVFYTNLFKYNSGVDSGDVLDTVKFGINEHDTGETMHFKNTISMKYLVSKNLTRLTNENFELIKQPDTTPTYYPKRTELDSLIDWEDDVYNIEKLIRAVTKPFNGAYSFINKQKIIIYRAHVFDYQDFNYINYQIGKVVEVFDNNKFLIKGYGGILLVHEYKYDLEIRKGDVLDCGEEVKKVFPINKFGFYDIE